MRKMKKVFLPLLMVAILIVGSMTVSAADYEAEFNGKQYATLEEAIVAASNESEGTLKLLSDVTIADLETATLITVASGQKLIVDLNGCTVDVTSDTAANTNVILNNGSLTITDTSAAKDGKITYEYVGTSCNYGGWGTYTLTNGNGATFVLEAGTLENTTSVASHIYYAINSTTYGSTITNVTINGGKVVNNNYTAIRSFENASEGKVVLTINGGTVQGTTGIYLQSPSTKTYSKGVLNINGGKVLSTRSEKQAVYVYGYGVEQLDGLSINVNGGLLDGYIHIYPETTDKEIVKVSDTFTVKKETLEYSSGTQSFYYTLACAHKAVTAEGAKAATCTEAGYTGDKVCDNCGVTVEKGTTIPATGHTYVNGACACGDKIEVKVETEVVDTITKEEVKVEEVKEVTVVEDENTVKAEISVNAETTLIATEVVAAEDVKETEAVKSGAITEETAEAVKEAVLAGDTVKTEIVVNEVKTELVPTSAQTNIEKAAATVGKNAEVVQYLDVEVVLKAASTGEELGTVNKLATPIKVTVAIPENLKAENVKYVVIRDHNGVVTKLPTTVNANGTITFETDMFSTYALAVADADVTAPKTGDEGMMPAAWVAIIAAAGIVFVAARRRSVVR